MNRLFLRAISGAALAILLIVGSWNGAAEDTGPTATEPADSFYGEPTLPRSEESDSTESERDEVMARIEATRAQLGGEPGEASKLNAIQELQRQQELYPRQMPGQIPPDGVASWRSLGPTRTQKWYGEANTGNPSSTTLIDSGLIKTILPHPTDPDTLYVLTTGGGLWKTTTFTHTNPRWEAKTDALLSTSGGSVAFGRNPDTLYLGIGDTYYVLGPLQGVMAKSTDGGDTWSPFVGLPGAIAVRDVKVDTSGPNDVVLVGTNVGLFRSIDDGATYTQVAAGVGQAFNGKSVWSLVKTSAGWLASTKAGGFGSIFYSADQGASWNPVPNTGNGYSGAGRTTLAVATAGESIVYAYAGAPDLGGLLGLTQRDLFKSTDGGLNWTALNITNKTPTNPNSYQRDMNIMGDQAYFNQMILIDPLDPSRNTVYIGGRYSTAKSTDGGNTWTLLSHWFPQAFGSDLPYVHADCHAAAFSTLGGRNTIFFGTDGGLFISQDGGLSWSDEKNDGIVSCLLYTITSSTKNPQTLLVGMQDNGARARLGSSTAYNLLITGDGFGMGLSQANNAVTLISVQFMNIFRFEALLPSADPSFLRRATNGIGGLDYYYFFTNIETPTATADPTGLQFFTYTGWRVYKTDDGANSWHVIGEAGLNGLRSKTVGNPPAFQPLFRQTYHGMGVSPTDSNRVAIAEIQGRLAITTDGGASWLERNLVSLVPGYRGFNGSPAWAGNNTTLYVASEALVNPNPLVKSTDGGVSWSLAQNGLPKVPIFRVLVDPRDAAGNSVYAATSIGVYHTADGGTNWSLFGAGLPRVAVTDLYLAPDGKFLRAATFGRGAWEITP